MKKTTLLFLSLISVFSLRQLQFSSYTTSYIVQLPNLQQYGQGQFKNPFDPYVPFTADVGENRQKGVIKCIWPFQFIHGSCQCPPGTVKFGDQCFGELPPRPTQTQEESTFTVEPITNNIDPSSISGLAAISRNLNGTNNNLQFPLWGSKNSLLQRRAPFLFKDGYSQPVEFLPNPRTLSNKLGQIQGEIQRNPDNISAAFVIFGQFLDHDVDLTPQGDKEQMNIEIPPGDNFFTEDNIHFFRSIFQNGTRSRQNPNVITSWVDGSQVYGSDEETGRLLRQFKDGKMRTSSGNLLPRQGNLFLAGDERANENIMLTTYHTLFVREHNRVCDELRQKQPYLNDEELYQAARHFVIGLLQKITYDDFLPLLLGLKSYRQHIGSYSGYKPHINPNIPTQFSSAGYRVGHSLLVNKYPFANKQGIRYHLHDLGELFFRPNLVNQRTIEDIIRGLQRNIVKQKSIKISSGVRNLLFIDPDRSIRLDLFSLNLQRCRDHGVNTYNEVRKSYGLPVVRTFDEMIPVNDPESVLKLHNFYQTPDKLELWIGIVAQKKVQGGILGDLGAAIVGQAFKNLRDGDRFWYEHAYPQRVIRQIKRTSLSDIIKRNTDVRQISDDFFHSVPY